MKKLICLVILLTCLCRSFAAITVADEKKFQQGAKLLSNGDPSGALLLFDQLKAENINSPALYSNMGNAYYNQKKYGKALAFYSKALALAPRDTQLMHNKTLAMARLKGVSFSEDAMPLIQLDDLLALATLLVFVSGLL